MARLTEGPISEFDDLIDVLTQEGVSSYLEIGSEAGVSLRRVAAALPTGSKIVCVDLPHGTNMLPLLKESIKAVKAMGHHVTHLIGDSTDAWVIERVRALGPFDVCLIDGNHSLPYVTADWQNYSPMCRMVAFHDIGWVPIPGKTPIEVPALWNEIKQSYRHLEFRRYHQKFGIGVLWRE